MFFRKDKSAKEAEKPAVAAKQEEPARGWFSGRRSRGTAAEPAQARPAAPPPPRRARRTGLSGLFSGILTVTLVLALVGGFIGMQASTNFTTRGPLALDRTVIIERGSSTEDIVEKLASEGVIEHSTWLWLALLYRDVTSRFSGDLSASKRAKSGEYLFKAGVTLNEVLDILSTGRSVQHTITIPEGLTSEQIVARLRENELLSGEIVDIPTEGALLPDTYRIERGMARQALIQHMAQQQTRLLNDIWNRRAKDLPLRSPRDLVILASIVEKETGKADERPRVASVFYNRIEKKMRLQSDPTIIYGIVGGKGALGRAITRSDIDRPTPYNTYTINGLPPGPIANPGRAAMEATANPSRTKDIYFVADGTGGHAFAETLEQHNRNVARWRQIEASRGSAPAALQPVPQVSPGALQGPAGNRTVAPPQLVPNPEAGTTLGFSAPVRRNAGGDLVPQPLPQREAVGTIGGAPIVLPRQP
jgi:UPF0755 protein